MRRASCLFLNILFCLCLSRQQQMTRTTVSTVMDPATRPTIARTTVFWLSDKLWLWAQTIKEMTAMYRGKVRVNMPKRITFNTEYWFAWLQALQFPVVLKWVYPREISVVHHHYFHIGIDILHPWEANSLTPTRSETALAKFSGNPASRGRWTLHQLHKSTP